MKKALLSFIFVALGAGTWWLTARTARFSIKKWDAKFESILRHNLTSMGIGDQDILSSVHEVKKDKKGEWVVHRLSVKLNDLDKRKELIQELEESGARVQQITQNNSPVCLVKRGNRIYQEISFN